MLSYAAFQSSGLLCAVTRIGSRQSSNAGRHIDRAIPDDRLINRNSRSVRSVSASSTDQSCRHCSGRRKSPAGRNSASRHRTRNNLAQDYRPGTPVAARLARNRVFLNAGWKAVVWRLVHSPSATAPGGWTNVQLQGAGKSSPRLIGPLTLFSGKIERASARLIQRYVGSLGRPVCWRVLRSFGNRDRGLVPAQKGQREWGIVIECVRHSTRPPFQSD